MTDLLEDFHDNVKASAVARVSVAEKWTGCITASVFMVCCTALILGFIFHG